MIDNFIKFKGVWCRLKQNEPIDIGCDDMGSSGIDEPWDSGPVPVICDRESISDDMCMLARWKGGRGK